MGPPRRSPSLLSSPRLPPGRSLAPVPARRWQQEPWSRSPHRCRAVFVPSRPSHSHSQSYTRLEPGQFHALALRTPWQAAGTSPGTGSRSPAGTRAGLPWCPLGAPMAAPRPLQPKPSASTAGSGGLWEAAPAPPALPRALSCEASQSGAWRILQQPQNPSCWCAEGISCATAPRAARSLHTAPCQLQPAEQCCTLLTGTCCWEELEEAP